VPHTDYSPNQVPGSVGLRYNMVSTSNQFAFYKNNLKNIGLDQIKSVQNNGYGLANLKTDYKTLRFGNDQPNGGSSGQPFITSNIPNTSSRTTIFGTRDSSTVVVNTPQGSISINNGSDSRSLFNDWTVRGGTYPSNEIDYRRINAFLKTTKGQQFIDKQKTLQFMNPKIETAPSFLDAGENSVIPGLIENTRVYNENNTLNQVAIQGGGFHLPRVGIPGIGIFQEFYANTVGLQNLSNSSTLNRLELLRKIKISGLQNSGLTNFGSIANIALAKKLGIALSPFTMFNYPGGPTSSDRQRNTIIGRYTDTTLVSSDTAMVYTQLAKQTPTQGGVYTIYKDFRKSIPAYITKSSGSLAWTNNLSQQKRIGAINAGTPYTFPNVKTAGGKPIDYTVNVAFDKLNMLMPYITTDTDPWSATTIRGAKIDAKDSVKLAFECLSNDNTSVSTALVFRALLSNGFTDNNTAVLNPLRYMGRGEEFFTYQGFTRDIGFSFKIAAFSRQELRPLYNKLNYLISQVYPDYSPNNSIMRAPIVKVTLGDYLYRVPGFLQSVNVTVDNSTSWEINLEESDDVQELPHVLEVSIQFKPIHDVLPERSSFTQYIKQGTDFISNNAGLGDTAGAAILQINTETTVTNKKVTSLIGNPTTNFIDKLEELGPTTGVIQNQIQPTNASLPIGDDTILV
jgi:hypothetical protein